MFGIIKEFDLKDLHNKTLLLKYSKENDVELLSGYDKENDVVYMIFEKITKK